MHELNSFFHQELKPIDAAIQQELADLHPMVRPVAAHILHGGGKRLRPLLTILTARAQGFTNPSVYSLAASLEIVHSATLIHDDIIDSAETRRGRPSTHSQYGVVLSILAGDALLALANRIVARQNIPLLVECISESIQQTASGEILEIALAGKPNFSHDDYLEIIIGKTAFLIQAAAESGVILADGNQDVRQAAREFGRNIGIAFQLVDDALDYEAKATKLGKPRGGDLKEGKVTLPLVLYAGSLEPAEGTKLLHSVMARDMDDDQLGMVVNAIDKHGFSERTRKEAENYIQTALEILPGFAAGPEAIILRQMAEYIITRTR